MTESVPICFVYYSSTCTGLFSNLDPKEVCGKEKLVASDDSDERKQKHL